jgi:SET domain-containing protein
MLWRRLMNHSCEPSLQQLHIMQLRGYPRIPFVAARHIYPGDELTIDYSAFKSHPLRDQAE